jgi:hypothetical protein
VIQWVCQSNLGNSEDIRRIAAACDSVGVGFSPYEVIPFSGVLPSVPSSSPTIFYGAVRWIDRIHRCKRWRPGVFLDEEILFKKWTAEYGEYSLNDQFAIVKLGEIGGTLPGERRFTPEMLLSPFVRDEHVFVRPVKDNKAVVGQLMKIGEMMTWSSRLSGDMYELAQEEVVISIPKLIYQEWRVFLVDGRAVCGSRYKKEGRLCTSSDTPREVLEFAESLARRYSPHDVFVMDVCELPGGDLRVVEIGCFNSAGFYQADISKIVETVSMYVSEMKTKAVFGLETGK